MKTQLVVKPKPPPLQVETVSQPIAPWVAAVTVATVAGVSFMLAMIVLPVVLGFVGYVIYHFTQGYNKVKYSRRNDS